MADTTDSPSAFSESRIAGTVTFTAAAVFIEIGKVSVKGATGPAGNVASALYDYQQKIAISGTISVAKGDVINTDDMIDITVSFGFNLAGSVIGGAIAGPPGAWAGGVIGSLIYDLLREIKTDPLAGITIYGAEGYWGETLMKAYEGSGGGSPISSGPNWEKTGRGDGPSGGPGADDGYSNGFQDSDFDGPSDRWSGDSGYKNGFQDSDFDNPRSGPGADSGYKNGFQDSDFDSPSKTDSSGPGWESKGRGSLIILDLDGDGVEVKYDAVANFDFDGDSYKEYGAWVAEDDGFLVIDLEADGSHHDGSGNGKIELADELILSRLTTKEDDTDLEAIKGSWLNTNKGTVEVTGSDGVKSQMEVLNASDEGWKHLRVWQDLDQDGETDTGELKTLSQLGITQINLGYDDRSKFSTRSNDITVGLATLHGLANYVRNGEVIKGGVGDMSLGHDDLGWKRVAIAGGYEYQFETGKRWRYADLATLVSKDFDLTAAVFDAAQGDDRDNKLLGSGSARSVQISGSAGADTVHGGNGDDLLSGGAGADKIYGNDGDDTLVVDVLDLSSGVVAGGSGFDLVRVEDNQSVNIVLKNIGVEGAVGGGGADTLSAAGLYENVRLSGMAGGDLLTDGFGDDLLSGDDGNDSLIASDGDDALFGGKGDDTLTAGVGDDQLYGGEGADQLTGGTEDDYLSGGSGNDTLWGGVDDDRIWGESGNDLLYAGTGDDTIDAGIGNDTLSFWRGDAELWGRAGDDTFKFEKLAEHGAKTHWGWSALFGGIGSDTLVVVGARAEWSWRKVDGNQWQFFRSVSTSETMIIDVVDIEKITFAGGGSDLVLGSFSDVNASDNYVRRAWGIYFGDDVASGGVNVSSGYTGGFYVDGVLNGWMGDDHLIGASLTSMTGGDDHTINTSTNYTDTINGGNGSDLISGLGGADSLIGSNGADRISAGDDNDTVQGDAGADQASGGSGNDSIVSGSGGDMVWGDAGNDTVYGGSGSDMMFGGDGADSLYAGSGADQISGGNQNDTLYGDTGYDRLYGDDGNDKLYGGAGSDYLYGGAGNDTLTGDDSLGGGFNYLAGGDGNDSLVGGVYDDQLAGDAGNDTLKGGEGRDALMGGAGADSLDGGGGILDVVSYETSTEAVTVSLGNVIDGVITQTASGGDATGDTLANFEQIIGGKNKDTLTGSVGDNMLAGSDGDDLLDGGDGDDDLWGDAGNDKLYGGAGVDRLYGSDGDDILVGGEGSDTLDGGDGTDTVDFTGLAVGVTADLRATSNDEAIIDEDLYISIEKVIGTDFGDTILGGFEDNTLDGKKGNDSLSGGAGNDTLLGGNGADTLSGGSGIDKLNGFADTVRDVFLFTSKDDSKVGASDEIIGFTSTKDTIDLSGIDANSVTAGNQAFIFNNQTAKANAIWYAASGSDVIVRGDVTGDTTADFEILVKAVSSLTAGDFIL